MSKAIRIVATGGPEVMQWVDVEVGEPGPGEVRIRQSAVGLNYIDVYFRTGLYPQPLPGGLGMEGAGVIEAVGADVTHVQVGDRVAYAGGPPGAYAEVRLMPAAILVKLPDNISFEQGAAMMLQGLTVHYLLHDSYKVRRGDTVLLHAAAGGIGLLACQWLKYLGATVIGTVGNDEKAALARENGCDHTIVYTRENFVERVREITGGKGVPVVYDSIGKDTFDGSIDCLAPRGMMVSYGNATGAVPPVDIGMLARKGSLRLTRPTVMTYVNDRTLLEPMAEELFALVGNGTLRLQINQRFALADAAQAHRALEARQTTGSTVFIP
jgi:NADPH2:quinone reductase